MENKRRVSFNILKKNTKCILRRLQERNDNVINDVKDLLEGVTDISDEELERIETVDHLWDTLVRKNVIDMDNLQVLKTINNRFLKSKELEKEIESHENESSEIAGRIAKVAIKTVLPVATGLVLLRCLKNEGARQVVLESLVLPPLMKLFEVREGSVCFVIETSSLSSLQQLWTSYKDGSLEKKFKKVINEIDEVRQLTQGTEIDVTVEIDEDEYREACWVLVLAKSHEFQDAVEKESSKGVQRLRQRRHSLSCGRDLLPPCDKIQLSWQEWRALMEVESKLGIETRRRMCVEKENEELRKEIEVEMEMEGRKSKDKLRRLQKEIEVLREQMHQYDEEYKKITEEMEMEMEGRKRKGELRRLQKEIVVLKIKCPQITDKVEQEKSQQEKRAALPEEISKREDETRPGIYEGGMEVLKGVKDTAEEKKDDV